MSRNPYFKSPPFLVPQINVTATSGLLSCPVGSAAIEQKPLIQITPFFGPSNQCNRRPRGHPTLGGTWSPPLGNLVCLKRLGGRQPMVGWQYVTSTRRTRAQEICDQHAGLVARLVRCQAVVNRLGTVHRATRRKSRRRSGHRLGWTGSARPPRAAHAL